MFLLLPTSSFIILFQSKILNQLSLSTSSWAILINITTESASTFSFSCSNESYILLIILSSTFPISTSYFLFFFILFLIILFFFYFVSLILFLFFHCSSNFFLFSSTCSFFFFIYFFTQQWIAIFFSLSVFSFHNKI